MKKILKFLLLFLLVAILYFCFWPVPIKPVAWTPAVDHGFTGAFAANEAACAMKLIDSDACKGCEDIAIDTNGVLYGGTYTGYVMSFDPRHNYTPKELCYTEGRPLGLQIDADNNLIVADTKKGLVRVNTMSGEYEVLVDSYDGKLFGLTDDVDIDTNGIIYFTDATDRFGIEDNEMDIFEHTPNGALYAYDPSSKHTTLLLDSLYFGNGVAVDPQQQFVLVNETSKYRIQKYYINGPKKGKAEIFMDNLPGFPDGISTGSDGIFWLTLISPRSQVLDDILPKPFMRKMMLRLPKSLIPKTTRYSCFLGLGQSGSVVYNLQCSDPAIAEVASIQEYSGKLYLGSLHETGIGVINRPQ